MKKNLQKVRKELKENIDLEYKKGLERFFKEPIELYGVRAGIVRKIASKHWKKIKDLNKKEIFNLCEELLKSNYLEESTITFTWARKKKDEFKKSDFIIFENWLKKYVNTWSKCDDFCTHAFGELIFTFPELLLKTEKWRRSKNRWVRRAASIIFIHSIKQKEKIYLKNIFEVSQYFIDIQDEDDLVQKGYGWTLKEAANIYSQEVFDFVLKNKKIMPRTALRYAIEKMPKDWKNQVMK
ncbi:MAG: DNA alkylation repair protein [Candidatus Moranbacteria bacterium]|nr:DNA alkylation repair protein [Candidatus Moranbacteria bacterium]